jgi:hypothetical protein
MTGQSYPLRRRASRLDGGAPPPIPFVPADKSMITECQKAQRKERRKERRNDITPLAPIPLLSPKPRARSITLLQLSRNIPTAVAAKKSITAWSHSVMETRLETSTCRDLPTPQRVAYNTAFHSSPWWTVHGLQWRKRCSDVWDSVHPHHPHLSSSRWPNSFR